MKNLLTKLWNEFIYGGHLLALGPVVIILALYAVLNMPISTQLLIVAYSIAYLVYKFDRTWDSTLDSLYVKKSILRYENSTLVLLIIFFSLLLLYLFRENSYQVTTFAFVLLLFGLMYSVFIKNLTKYLIGFKSFFVALSYTAVTYLFTLYNNVDFNLTVLLVFLFFYIRWFINTSFCDCKDREEDRARGLKTLAAYMKGYSFVVLLQVLNIISIVPIAVGIMLNTLPIWSILFISAPIYFAYLVAYTAKMEKSYEKLANIWADGEIFIWLGVVLLGGEIWSF
ncbi:MAG: UbiA family prenyltransferase [Patescibacteria group bacterium]